jgi:BirA family transcriptional regulator, biotin operon repressor / biotin---[acetyl-CoA-carboxylase] ligase
MTTLKNWVEALPERHPHPIKTIYLDKTASTNDEAMALGKSGEQGPLLIVANSQSQGHGRLSRPWESPPEKGLYFSILMCPVLEAKVAPLLTLAAGLGLIAGLRNFRSPPLLMKWPNDILIGGKKLGGILTEMQNRGNQVDFVVIGIGINVGTEPGDFSRGLTATATSLKQVLKRDLDRAEVLEKVFPEVLKEMDRFVAEGSSPLVKRWEESSGMVGKQIEFGENGQRRRGRVLGLARDGQLKIQTEDGVTLDWVAGDITLCS